MNDKLNIPESWEMVEYGELLNYLQPTKFIVKSTDYSDDYDIPVLTAGKTFIKGYTNEKDGVFENVPVIIFDDFTTDTKYVDFPFKVKSSAMKILLPCCDLVNLKYLFYVMQTTKVRNDTHKRYWISTYSKLTFPLPPLNEQKRIVAKIDKLFAELDNATEKLQKAKQLTAHYRQALLKAAFEGKLTEKWREQQKNLPTAEQLLEQIKQERQKHYKQQLEQWQKAVADWEKNGKTGKKPKKPGKNKFFLPPNREEIANFHIPISWSWTRLGCITYKIGDVDHKMPHFENEGYPYISTSDITEKGEIDFTAAKRIKKDDFIRLSSKIKPEKGDIIFPRYGTIGRNVLVSVDNEFLVSYSCAIIKIIKKLMNNKYVFYFLKSFIAKKEINKYVVETTQANIGITSIEKFIIPLCSLSEQNEIVRILDEQFSVLDKLEQEIDNGLKKAELLRQSILKQAFEGLLVPQDPTDEPASKLLQRIRESKNALLSDNKKQNIKKRRVSRS